MPLPAATSQVMLLYRRVRTTPRPSRPLASAWRLSRRDDFLARHNLRLLSIAAADGRGDGNRGGA